MRHTPLETRVRVRDRATRLAAIGACVMAATLMGAKRVNAPDAHRLATGEFVISMIDKGREVGRARITITEHGQYTFAADFTGQGAERWQSVATPALQPVSARIAFGQEPPTFSIDYHADRVTGFVVSHGTRRTVDDSVPVGVIDQRIDWAAVMARELAAGEQFEFMVYDPSIGISRATAQVGAVERLQVPAGTFDVYPITYRIAKSTGTEEYHAFATRDEPRMLVRETFPDGEVSDLVEVKRK